MSDIGNLGRIVTMTDNFGRYVSVIPSVPGSRTVRKTLAEAEHDCCLAALRIIAAEEEAGLRPKQEP